MSEVKKAPSAEDVANTVLESPEHKAEVAALNAKIDAKKTDPFKTKRKPGPKPKSQQQKKAAAPAQVRKTRASRLMALGRRLLDHQRQETLILAEMRRLAE